jgi:uncharacterized protein (TIGR02996 family)
MNALETRRSSLYRSFIQDILENPEDDAPRLILADWLDENGGEAEADLIRQEFPPKGRRRPAGDYRRLLASLRYPFAVKPAWATWNHAEQPLLVASAIRDGVCWIRERPGWFHVDVRHGFVVGLGIPWRGFCGWAAELFRRNPIRHVFLFDYQSPSDLMSRRSDSGEGPPWYRSWSCPPSTLRSEALPSKLWERLAGYKVERQEPGGHRLHRCWRDKPAAMLALSEAAVALGRELACAEENSL